ncbi:MAG: UDP-2,3-diacylglucosamine diphosphatase [Pseudomonadota bacterium]
MQTLLISDLHLQASEPEVTGLAFALFTHVANSVDEIYILGDLFEYWIGDDASDHTAREVASRLRSLSNSGIRISVMHGNRDFLLGEKFVESFGGKLFREDIITVDIAGRKTLLMHGDTLCTDDKQYQFYRRMVRNTGWQSDFLAKSVSEREATARMIRSTSQAKGHRAHTNNIADINRDTLEETLSELDVERLIHGHTHRPAHYEASDNQQSVERMVLGDWHADHAMVALANDSTCKLYRWDGNSLSATD